MLRKRSKIIHINQSNSYSSCITMITALKNKLKQFKCYGNICTVYLKRKPKWIFSHSSILSHSKVANKNKLLLTVRGNKLKIHVVQHTVSRRISHLVTQLWLQIPNMTNSNLDLNLYSRDNYLCQIRFAPFILAVNIVIQPKCMVYEQELIN